MEVEEWWNVCRHPARCVQTCQKINRDADITREIERRPAAYWTSDRHVLGEISKMLQGKLLSIMGRGGVSAGAPSPRK